MIAVVADTIFEIFKIPAELSIIGIPIVILINLFTAGALLFVLRRRKPQDLILLGGAFIIECIPVLEVFPTWVALVLALKAGGRI